MISPSEAEDIIRRSVSLLDIESRPLASLTGAVLREPIAATRDQPPFDRVTMDGIAFSSASGRRTLRIAGTQAAGARQMILANDDACFEVMTGAVLPHGCDCVVPIEISSIEQNCATLSDDLTIVAGMNVHPRGFDCKAGDARLDPG